MKFEFDGHIVFEIDNENDKFSYGHMDDDQRKVVGSAAKLRELISGLTRLYIDSEKENINDHK